MGERKGTNKYYPPDYDPRKGSLNAFHGTHALRERAKKIHLGILVIRFEMPYNIWCEGCGIHIARGVRYNAEKKKVGNYYTTSIYQFRMKCHLCETYFEIKTDPQRFDYEIVSGCSRQERRWEPEPDEMAKTTGREAAKKLATDAMYKLEHGEDDKTQKKSVEPVINDLERLQRRLKDDYTANQRLRGIFRKRKKELIVEKKADDATKKRANLQIDLLPESADDRKVAKILAEYATRFSIDDNETAARKKLEQDSIFGGKSKQTTYLELLRKRRLAKAKSISKSKPGPFSTPAPWRQKRTKKLLQSTPSSRTEFSTSRLRDSSECHQPVPQEASISTSSSDSGGNQPILSQSTDCLLDLYTSASSSATASTSTSSGPYQSTQASGTSVVVTGLQLCSQYGSSDDSD